MSQPSNTQILKEIRDVKDTILDQARRIGTLEEWRIAVQAVDQYRASHSKDPSKKIEERLLQLLGWALLIAAGALGVKLL